MFFFGISKDTLNRLTPKRIADLSKRGMPDILGPLKVIFPDMPVNRLFKGFAFRAVPAFFCWTLFTVEGDAFVDLITLPMGGAVV